MREIKFRAWDNLNKKWMLGYDYKNLGGFSMVGEVMMFGEYEKMLNSFSLKDLDKIVIEQFTGLFDKNGVEIYEGDIVTGTYYKFGQKYNFTGEVKYVITAFKVVGAKSYNGMHQELNSIYEIIGNIHTQKP